MAVDGAFMALLFRLDLRRQRALLPCLFAVEPASCALLAMALYSLLRVTIAPRTGERQSWTQDVLEGLRFVRRDQLIYGLIGMTFVNSLFGMSYVVLLPVMVLSGLTMSPAVTAAAPVLFDLFGGRQSARTIHFIAAWLIVAFVLIHVFEVVITGLWNNLRSMITGRYRIPPEAPHE